MCMECLIGNLGSAHELSSLVEVPVASLARKAVYNTHTLISILLLFS